jgi:hypothetical protein
MKCGFAFIVALIFAAALSLPVNAGSWYVTVDQSALAFGDSVTFTAAVPKAALQGGRTPQYPGTSPAIQVDCYQAGVRVYEDFAPVASKDHIDGGWIIHTGPLPMMGPTWTSGGASCSVIVWYVDNHSPNNFVIVATTTYQVGA